MPKTLEELQQDIIAANERITALETERDTLKANNEQLTADNERIRAHNQKLFEKVAYQVIDEEQEEKQEPALSCEEFAKGLKI